MVIASYTGSPKEVESYLAGRNSLIDVKLESTVNEAVEKYDKEIRNWATVAHRILDRHDH